MFTFVKQNTPKTLFFNWAKKVEFRGKPAKKPQKSREIQTIFISVFYKEIDGKQCNI